MENAPKKDNWLTRNWKWVVPVGCLGAIIICLGCILLFTATVFGMLKPSDAYQQTVTKTQESVAATQR